MRAPTVPGVIRDMPPYSLLVAGGCALFAWLTPTHELPWTSFHREFAMAGGVLAGAVISAGLALCQWLRLDLLGFLQSDLPDGVDARPFANLGQPNLLATLLMLGLLATAILYNVGRFGAPVALPLVALLGFSLAMTQS